MTDRTRKKLFYVTLATALLCALVAAHQHFATPKLSMTVLDVGQGDAILIRCAAHDTLIDGGPDTAVLAALGRALPPYDRTIERLILTHAHRDHYLGLISVMERYRVGELLLAEDDHDNDPEYARLLATAKSNHIPLRRIAKGDTLPVATCATLETLWPLPAPVIPAQAGIQNNDDPNTSSIVLRLTRPNSPRPLALLTGDATAEVERALLDSHTDLRADVLKIAHHGSRTSTTPAFIAAVTPKIAIVSAGKKNTYGHPAYVVLERLKRTSAQVFRTDRNGSVRIIFPPAAPPRVRSEK